MADFDFCYLLGENWGQSWVRPVSEKIWDFQNALNSIYATMIHLCKHYCPKPTKMGPIGSWTKKTVVSSG